MTSFYTTNTMRQFHVDDIDAEAVSAHLWFEKQSRYTTYVATSVRIGLKVKTLRLHRFIADRMGLVVRPHEDVHHKDTNTFINTRDNLEVMGRAPHRRLHASLTQS